MSPIKVLHFADVHLGAENYGRLDPSIGLSSRLTDFLSAIDRIIDAAFAEKVDLVVFAGDAYKTRDPSPTYQREFARRVRRLSQAGLPTVLLAGSHDIPNAVGRAHTMEIFDTLDVENVYVARCPDLLTIATASGPVQVGLLPWIVRNSLLSREEYRNRSLQEIGELLLQRLDDVLNGENGLVSRLAPGIPRILIAHGTVRGAVYGSERSVLLGQETALPLSMLKNSHWDYVALGHVHRHQELEPERSPPVVYAGSVERIDFGEEKEDKGFVVASVGRGHCSWSFHKLNARPFLTIRVTADGDDPTATILDAIGRASIDGAIVRLIVDTTAERDVLIREPEIRRALQNAFYVAAVIHDVQRPERVRLGGQQEIATLTPLQALEWYLQSREMPQERLKTLISHAESLLTSHQ